MSGNHHGHVWVLGLALERDELAVPAVPGVSYTYNLPAIFAQDESAPTPWLKFAGSARVDAHNAYGTFLSPRLFSAGARAAERMERARLRRERLCRTNSFR
ncbi:MAG: hypothetical protein E6K52_01035 [Gammaproteobacteria bacterium]|nr:MAG: hypothetical protein E6K52_01035 [Gammaproteobacteria bacterium]